MYGIEIFGRNDYHGGAGISILGRNWIPIVAIKVIRRIVETHEFHRDAQRRSERAACSRQMQEIAQLLRNNRSVNHEVK